MNLEIIELKKYIKIDFLKDSLIINDSIHTNLIKNWINPQKTITSKLLYKLSLNGKIWILFIINEKSPTLSIILLKGGIIIGGYIFINWNTNGGWMEDNNTFIFNLTKNITMLYFVIIIMQYILVILDLMNMQIIIRRNYVFIE